MAKAAVTRRIRDDHQKNFLKIFNSLTGKHSRWEIWEDFVTLTAIEISNSTDKVNAPERTKMYQTIVSKYSAKERDGMVEMLAEVIMGMEQNPDQDFLGSLYMMCELGNDHAGQFFTPYDVCRCMAEITFDPKLHPDMEGFISVSDPACGAGATLLAFLNVCKRRNICYHNKVLVIAQDIDFIVGLMCYIKWSHTLGQAGTQYASCRVSYVGPNGKPIEGIAYVKDYDAKSKTNQQLEVYAPVTSKTEAKELAAKKLRLHNKFERQVGFTYHGDPGKVAGLTFETKSFGPWDGKYIVKQAKHTVTGSGGYTTQVSGRHVLGGY